MIEVSTGDFKQCKHLCKLAGLEYEWKQLVYYFNLVDYTALCKIAAARIEVVKLTVWEGHKNCTISALTEGQEASKIKG